VEECFQGDGVYADDVTRQAIMINALSNIREYLERVSPHLSTEHKFAYGERYQVNSGAIFKVMRKPPTRGKGLICICWEDDGKIQLRAKSEILNLNPKELF
jgi:hypothetical protein